MTRAVVLAVGVAVTVVVPAVLAVNGLRLIMNDRFVEAVYDHGAIPDDRYGMRGEERRRLAVVGLRSIEPGSEGVGLLREATLADGTPAFGARELGHMQDVRTLVDRACRFQLAALLAIAVLAVALGWRRSTRTVVPGALRRGALLTVGLAALAGVLALVSYDSFEAWFHGPLFEGDSWRFAETDTLRRLYPDRFWLDTAIMLGTLAILQAVALFLLAGWWARRVGAREALGPRTRTQST